MQSRESAPSLLFSSYYACDRALSSTGLMRKTKTKMSFRQYTSSGAGLLARLSLSFVCLWPWLLQPGSVFVWSLFDSVQESLNTCNLLFRCGCVCWYIAHSTDDVSFACGVPLEPCPPYKTCLISYLLGQFMSRFSDRGGKVVQIFRPSAALQDWLRYREKLWPCILSELAILNSSRELNFGMSSCSGYLGHFSHHVMSAYIWVTRWRTLRCV